MIPTYYFDGVHLICEDLKALHKIARRIGLKRAYFQKDLKKLPFPGKHEGIPHYDVWGRPGEKLLNHPDVKKVSPKELIKLAKGFKERG